MNFDNIIKLYLFKLKQMENLIKINLKSNEVLYLCCSTYCLPQR